MTRGLRRGLTLGAAPAIALAAVVVFSPGLQSGASGRQRPQQRLPPPPNPAFLVPRPSPLSALQGASQFAPVRRAAIARAAPSPRAAPVATVPLRTPEGTTNILELLGRARLEASGLWQRVRLAVLPNGTGGWVRRSALGGLVLLDTRLVIDRVRFRATLFRNGVRVLSAPVGIGKPQWATPKGDFYVRDVLRRYRSPSYGPIAFGTSARSATLTGWPAGGYIGIHGTDQPNLIPGQISHGCIRMRNVDILKLARQMPIGTPVIIR
jgi:L,D-transpeptidase catalytic domain